MVWTNSYNTENHYLVKKQDRISELKTASICFWYNAIIKSNSFEKHTKITKCSTLENMWYVILYPDQNVVMAEQV